MTEILDLRPGIRVWFGGASWEVVALHGLEVTLRSGPSLQRVAVTEIAARLWQWPIRTTPSIPQRWCCRR